MLQSVFIYLFYDTYKTNMSPSCEVHTDELLQKPHRVIVHCTWHETREC
jgi:hypothetical protein